MIAASMRLRSRRVGKWARRNEAERAGRGHGEREKNRDRDPDGAAAPDSDEQGDERHTRTIRRRGAGTPREEPDENTSVATVPHEDVRS